MNGLTEILATVKVLQEAFPAVNTLASGAAGGLITHLLARRLDDRKHQREKEASAAKQKSELQFISIELIYLLEAWARECHLQVNRPERNILPSLPVPEIDSVKGNWQVLPVRLMYQIRELVAGVEETRSTEARYLQVGGLEDVVSLRNEDFLIKAGLKAIRLSRWLRRINGFSPSRLVGHNGSVHQWLWTEHRNRVRERAINYAESVGRMTRSVPDTPAQRTWHR